jgi:beta-lactamase class A
MRRLLVLLALATAAPAAAQGPPRIDPALQRSLDSLVAARRIEVGVAVIDVPSGAQAAVNGGQPFTMMSVYKFPIAVVVLRRVAAGRLALDSVFRLTPADRRPGPGRDPLAWRIPREGLTLPLRDLLRLAVVESDNPASDALLRLLTPAATTREISRIVPRGIRIDRQEGEIAVSYRGGTLLPGETPTPEAVSRAGDRVPADRRAAAVRAFPDDPRDTSTPVAMARLLVALSRGRALPPRETSLLRGMMERTVTGPNRLRAGLPRGIALAHRTGTAGGSSGRLPALNDVGLIAIPGHGDVAVAVFVRNAPEADAEALIADIARLVHRHYAAR